MSLFREKPEEDVDAQLDPFCLTWDEAAIAGALSKRILISADNKIGINTLSVTMQDTFILAALTDAVMSCLQNT